MAGSGLAGIGGVSAGDLVSEAQMKALFGAGLHPDAEAIAARLRSAGESTTAVEAATRLGRPFPVYTQATSTFLADLRAEYQAWNRGHGRVGDAPVPEGVRQHLRTVVAGRGFEREHGRAPSSREAAAYITRNSRQPQQAVAGYDLTFSPVKSVSTLWALASRPVAERIEACQAEAVADVIAWIEAEIAHTRLGARGVRQVDVRGVIATAFVHRDTRAGDPDLHTHVAISNKVQTVDGGWYALDGQPLHQGAVAASERYNTRLEALLRDRLGVRFVDTPHPQGRRLVREIVGVDTGLLGAWSKRRTAIDVERADLATAFTATHGRPPSTIEALHLAQQATLATRQGKPAPRSLAEQRRAWRAEAETVLGSRTALDDMIRTALPPARRPSAGAGSPVPREPFGPGSPGSPTRSGTVPRHLTRDGHPTTVPELADEVLGVVSAQRAHWHDTHVLAEAHRQARRLDLPAADLPAVVDAIVTLVLDRSMPITPPERTLDPPIARRGDGTSVYTRAHSTLYTSEQVLPDERTVLTASDRTDGRTIDPLAVTATIAESTVTEVPLNPGQVQLVTALATSGARVQVAMAPAGAGKTTAMTALTAAWTSRGGDVLSLGPSAVAAAELGAATGTRARTLAEVVVHHAGAEPPDWITAIGPQTLIVVDEAGMAATGDLAILTRLALATGASIRLIGDDRQLAAVGAGGLLRDLTTRHDTPTLTEVVRFDDQAEAAATLALRDGDVDALGFYLDHDRVHDVDQATLPDAVLAAWASDIATGATSLMMASDLTTVTALNAVARTHRLTTTGQPRGREVSLRSGLHACAGDTVITRRNRRALRITGTDFVKNGDRFTVTAVTSSGGLRVRHHGTDRHLTPARRLRERTRRSRLRVHRPHSPRPDRRHRPPRAHRRRRPAGALRRPHQRPRRQPRLRLARGRRGPARRHPPRRDPPAHRGRHAAPGSSPATAPSPPPPPPRPPPKIPPACSPPPPPSTPTPSTWSPPQPSGTTRSPDSTQPPRRSCRGSRSAPPGPPSWDTSPSSPSRGGTRSRPSPTPHTAEKYRPPATRPPSSTGDSTPPATTPPGPARCPGSPTSPTPWPWASEVPGVLRTVGFHWSLRCPIVVEPF